MIWTVVPLGCQDQCGNCLAIIAGDQPVALLGHKQRRRCERCAAALGFTPDAQDLDLVRFQLEQARIAQPAPSPPRPLLRMPAPRRPMPLSAIAASLPFDPRAAAAGRDD